MSSHPNVPPSLRQRLRATPHLLVPGLLAWMRGWWLKLWLPFTGRRFRAGPWLRVYGPLRVSGPGRVELGRNCLIIGNAIRPVCIRTLAPEATVRLGDHAGLNGTSIQCIERVEIGALSNIADAYVTDTAGHVLGRERRQLPASAAPHAPVVIERNVWVSASCLILHGVRIGADSVIGAGSLVRKDVPSGVFAVGNPLHIVKSLDEP